MKARTKATLSTLTALAVIAAAGVTSFPAPEVAPQADLSRTTAYASGENLNAEKMLKGIEWLDNKDPSKGFAVNFEPAIRLSEIAKATHATVKATAGTSDTGEVVKMIPLGRICRSFFIGQVGQESVSIELDLPDDAPVGVVLKAIAVFVRDEYLTKPKEFKTGNIKLNQVAPVTRLVWMPGDDWWEVVMDADAK
jgi:hypothetical protein